MKLLTATLLSLLTFTNITYVFSGINGSISRYSGLTINKTDLSRLQNYEHLITYFSSIAFFDRHQTISPEFIKALLYAESSLQENAKSPKNALGLGQIMYTTGKLAAHDLSALNVNFAFVDETTLAQLRQEDLYDPAINILLTCYLVSKYNYLYDGRLELVLTAWNAGENHHSLKKKEPAEYRETEELIGKVNGYYLFFLKSKIRSH